MFYSNIRDDSTRYANNMNDNKKAQSLRELAADLGEIHDTLSHLCEALQGGGIVQARDIEAPIADAVPRLGRAISALNSVSSNGGQGTDKRDPGEPDSPSRSPLLI